jgi:glycyl-tRNA synthetase beta chain
MQAKARADLEKLFTERLAEAGVKAASIETYATPRRLALIARGLPAETEAKREERRGPREDAPDKAVEGFLRGAGLSRDQLEVREEKKGRFYFAVIETPGRKTADILADAIPAIVRAFPWPKSMRWGEASRTMDALRWVRPLQGIVALLDGAVVPCEVGGITSGRATVGHRFMSEGEVQIASADDYADKLRAARVIVDAAERQAIILEGAKAACANAGLTLIEDEGLLAENAGLTEWPVPLLGRFDEAFLEVPPEVIQLAMKTHQKYFSVAAPPPTPADAGATSPGAGGGSEAVPSAPAFAGEAAERSHEPAPAKAGGGGGLSLTNAFVCTANIEAADGGAQIMEGNRKVLAARLSDARFFWEQDLKTGLDAMAEKLGEIVFHEKLGTIADKVERVAKLARWLVEEGIVPGADADEAERAARLAKADLVSQMVYEFPELQGIMGGYYAAQAGEDPEVAAAIRDHYKPVGQNDDVPTAPVTVAVSLADKLDTLASFFAATEQPTGSRDPQALRRSALSSIRLLTDGVMRLSLAQATERILLSSVPRKREGYGFEVDTEMYLQFVVLMSGGGFGAGIDNKAAVQLHANQVSQELLAFFADRLKVQQREAGVRHDLIDAVFALGGEDDIVRLLARVKALQAFMEGPDGPALLTGYKRANNILKAEAKKGYLPPGVTLDVIPANGHPSKPASMGPKAGTHAVTGEVEDGRQGNGVGPNLRQDDRLGHRFGYTPEPAEAALAEALDQAIPAARTAVAEERFADAMSALAGLRAPVDAFFDAVTVNDDDAEKRANRLGLLARLRDAAHEVADFSKIEG